MGMPGKKNKKVRKKDKTEIELDDEFTNMETSTLNSAIENFQHQLNDLKVKRNYVQMERDMIDEFFGVTKNGATELDDEITNIETEMERLEECHRVEIKVYVQKVKHLEYEHKIAKEKV